MPRAASLFQRVQGYALALRADEVDEALLATEMWALVQELSSNPLAALGSLSKAMAEADAPETASGDQILVREVLARLGTLVAYRTRQSPDAMRAYVREFRGLLEPDQRTARLASGLGVFEALRREFDGGIDRFKWQESFGPLQYAIAVRHSLAQAEVASSGGDRRRWERWAWHLAHGCKGRMLCEKLGADDGPPPEPDRLRRALRAAYGNRHGRRALLVEFFIVNEADIRIFVLPLWSRYPMRVRAIAGPAADLLRLAKGLFGSIARLQANADDTQQAVVSERIGDLGALIDPIRRDLLELDPTDLVISPHRWIGALPLAALPFEGGPLGLWRPTTILPTPALACRLTSRAAQPTRAAPRATILGCGTPWSGAEAELVEMEAQAAGWECLRSVAGQATQQALLSDGQGAALLHVAAHSVLERSDFAKSGIELADCRVLVDTIAEGLRLAPGALVFLSSCDTGRAMPTQSDELMALARAFLVAGAGSVVATLWEADDSAAVAFACTFYRALLRERLPVAAAYRSALSAAYGRRPGRPFYWAPAILMIGAEPPSLHNPEGD